MDINLIISTALAKPVNMAKETVQARGRKGQKSCWILTSYEKGKQV